MRVSQLCRIYGGSRAAESHNLQAKVQNALVEFIGLPDILLNLFRRNPEEKLTGLQIPFGGVVALGPGAVASLRAGLIPAKLGAGLVVPESAKLISGSAVADVHLRGDVQCLVRSGMHLGLLGFPHIPW